MQCPQCRQDNPPQAKFCLQCGHRFALTCTSCNTELPINAKFCFECGQAVATQFISQPRPAAPESYTPHHLAEKIVTAKHSLEGERKQVTVLFADIKGSTELIRDLDPEVAQQLLDPAIHHMMDAVHRYEGTVNQVLGDGIMALFGAPLAHEDHAVRSCYAALAMQEAMRDYTDEVRRSHGIEMHIRVGLNSGEVVVRAIGNDLHMDYSAVGATTHLAARMEQLATPGSIRLTADTLRLVEGFVRVEALGPVPVKGMDEPVEVFELLSASAVRRRLQAAVARGLTRFVGRETEISALQRALHLANAGRGQVVAAIGEAGLGKSRLFHEFIRSHRTRDWLVLESTSVSYGKATPYFPIIDLLRRYGQIEDGDTSRAMRAKLTGQVLTLDAELQDALPPLLSLLDVLPGDDPFLRLDPLQRRQRTLDALKRLLLRESQVQPLLLVFEDLHWIDSETQTLLDSLVDSLPLARLLLLVNYRPEYQHGWGSKTYYTQLRLDPLPAGSADELLRALLGDDPGLTALKQLLIERTGGNPFFLEESVRTLLEIRALLGEPGAYRLGQALPTIQVPPTVQAVLAARIDRLPAQEKQLLQTAAVIGTEVPFTLLQAIADVSDDGLQRGLAHLQTAEFLYETSLFPEIAHTFKHALTHEVAYGSMLQERRRTLHARVVEALEAVDAERPGEQVDRLAHHAFRGECWEKAVAYFRLAGARAVGQSAFQEAVACFEQALSALRQLPESRATIELAIDLRFDFFHLPHPLSEHEQIHTYLQEAQALAESLADARRLCQALGYLGFYFRWIGDSDRAITLGQRAMSLAMAGGDFDLQILSHHFLGHSYHALGDYPRAIKVRRWVIDHLDGDLIYERFGLPVLPAVICRAGLAMGLAETGAFADAMAIGEEAVHIAEASEHLFSQMQSQIYAALLCFRKGDFGRPTLSLERLFALTREASFFVQIPLAATALGYAYAHAGRTDDALPLLDLAVEKGFPGGRLFTPSFWRNHLSEAFLLANRIDDAGRHAERALTLSTERNDRGDQAHALHLMGDIALQGGPSDVERAEAYYQQALALANELGMRPLVAHCQRGLGRLHQQMGRVEQAHAELSTAIALYREMEMTFWLPQTQSVLAWLENDND